MTQIDVEDWSNFGWRCPTCGVTYRFYDQFWCYFSLQEWVRGHQTRHLMEAMA